MFLNYIYQSALQLAHLIHEAETKKKGDSHLIGNINIQQTGEKRKEETRISVGRLSLSKRSTLTEWWVGECKNREIKMYEAKSKMIINPSH